MRFVHSRLFRSVPGRLSLLAAGILLPALALVSWTLTRLYRNDRDAMEWQLMSDAASLCHVIDSHLETREALLKGLATSQFLRSEDFDAFRAQAARLVPAAAE